MGYESIKIREGKKGILQRFKALAIILGISFALLAIYVNYLRWLPYIFTGVIDGLNVCSLSLMALIISLIYNANLERNTTFSMGAAYILGVFSSYLLIGLGILWFSLSFPTHFFTKLSVIIMLSIGIVNIIGYIHPGLIPSNPIKSLSRVAIKRMRTPTVLSVLMAGVLVGLHNLPCCTGGIYITSLSFIARDPSAIIPLLSYNFGYILPLISILIVCSNKSLTLKFRKRYAENTRKMRLILGVIMVLASLIIISITA